MKSFKPGVGARGGGGQTHGNFGIGVQVCILKPSPIIYPAFEKKTGLFIYLISQKVDLFIYCSLNLYILSYHL